MGAWGFLADVLAVAAGVLLLIALTWAALERGRVHRWARQRQKAPSDGGGPVIEGFVAVGTIVGCV